MTSTWWKNFSRSIFRWYLSKFPLRDGKARAYAALQETLLPGQRFIVTPLDPGFTMDLDLADPEQRKLYYYGHYHERYEARLICRCLEPGEVFWDVGAHVGYFTLLAAGALGTTGRVAAFEPAGEAFVRLTRNLALNPGAPVLAVKAAVADAAGEAVLYSAGDTVDSSASLFAPGAGQLRQEVVETVTLDGFSRRQGGERPDFIKMDVEGAELAALRGGREILASSPPLILIEMEEKIFQRVGVDQAAILDLLGSLGYVPVFLHKGKWCLKEALRGKPGRNIFWFNPQVTRHREKAARIPVLGIY